MAKELSKQCTPCSDHILWTSSTIKSGSFSCTHFQAIRILSKCTGSSILARHSLHCGSPDPDKIGSNPQPPGRTTLLSRILIWLGRAGFLLFVPFYSFKHMPFYLVCEYAARTLVKK